ncbi:DUF4249 family protein [Echinicola jeungdonensis]|uniref:DUF4249 family protein n=1 Tax=Echinicola jeungdonensis TaxID=709343 RepID=A0ABV5J7J7_9BACT|nr:DUF4249 family protein [Echinicola jeungdonensis]MDN3670987.1 DUF4249 family protein [Echinicola jeungdonensis]
MKKLFLILTSIWSLLSCQEEVHLELEKADPMPVIEANWTNREAYNNVKISYSSDYYDSSSYELYKDAEVFIMDDENGQKIPFQFNEKNGSYLPIDIKKGEIGHKYTLNVQMEGHKYKSSGIMLAPPVLDSVTYTYKEERALRPAGYYLKIYGKIPFESNNFYRVFAFSNPFSQVTKPNFLLFDDTFGTSLLDNGFEIENIPFQEGETAYLGLFRLNRDVYTYMSELLTMVINDGGLFSPPPQNPTSNIELLVGKKEALGYFLVSPLITEKVEIEAETD